MKTSEKLKLKLRDLVVLYLLVSSTFGGDNSIFDLRECIESIRDVSLETSVTIENDQLERTTEYILNAIVGQESNHNYSAVNPHSGAVGFAQVMPANVRNWSQEILGYSVTVEEFLQDPELQYTIVSSKIRQYYEEEIIISGGDTEVAVLRVASRWYSGVSDWYTSTTPQFYLGHPYPSINEYCLSVLERFRQQG